VDAHYLQSLELQYYGQILQKEQELNRLSRDKWKDYTSHRKQVMNLLMGANKASNTHNSLCVFGAGNANDLELHSLLKAYKNIHLIDIDTEALHYAIQNVENKKIQIHGNIDLSGLQNHLPKWMAKPTGAEISQIETAVKASHLIVKGLPPGSCDVTISTCVLHSFATQIARFIGHDHNPFAQIVNAARTFHVQSMMQYTKQNGRIILISDMVSSTAFPSLSNLRKKDLTVDLLENLIADRQFFTGANPKEIVNALRSSPFAKDVTLLPPWKWKNISPVIVFAIQWTNMWKERPAKKAEAH